MGRSCQDSHMRTNLVSLAIALLLMASENQAIAAPTELANRYLNSRPELYGGGLLVAIGVVQSSQLNTTPEEFEAGILREAKMLNRADDWNATHPRWQEVTEKIRQDA